MAVLKTMKRKSFLVKVSSFFIIFLLASCAFFDEPVKEYFEEYTESAAVISFLFDGDYPKNASGVYCIPSGADRTVTFSIRNPQFYSINSAVNFSSESARTAASANAAKFSQTSTYVITMTLPDE